MPARSTLFVEECVRVPTSGPSIACIPGIAGTTTYFRARVQPLVVTGRRLVLVDPLGFGRSPKPFVRYTIERHVAELRRALAPHAPFTLVGHSLGARMAIAYAARFPVDVARLVLLSLPFFATPADAKAWARRSGGWYHWAWTNQVAAAIMCVVSRRVFGHWLARLAPDMPEDIIRDSTTHTWRSSTSTLWEVLYRYDVSADIARLAPAMPVTLVHGEVDQSAPIANVRALAEGHPTWRLVTLPGVDHNPLLRDPDAVLKEMAAAR